MGRSAKTKISTTPTMSPSIPDRCGRTACLGTAALLLVTACSSKQPGEQVDIGNAARAAHESVGAYASQSLKGSGAAITARPATSPTTSAAITPSPTAAATPDAEAETNAPSAADEAVEPGADRAAAVVERYLALIAAHDFAAARSLWDQGGAASGMSAEEFGASFPKYRTFKAEVGEPGPIEAGAGQRYVTVPVRVTGTLRTGAPFVLAGPITLHRSGNIDGATAEQRRWHISASGLKPQTGQAGSAAGDQVTARFRCTDGFTFTALFDNAADVVTLILPSGKVRLPSQRPASGIWYAGQGYELRGKGRDATLAQPSGPRRTCRADG